MRKILFVVALIIICQPTLAEGLRNGASYISVGSGISSGNIENNAGTSADLKFSNPPIHLSFNYITNKIFSFEFAYSGYGKDDKNQFNPHSFAALGRLGYRYQDQFYAYLTAGLGITDAGENFKQELGEKVEDQDLSAHYGVGIDSFPKNWNGFGWRLSYKVDFVNVEFLEFRGNQFRQTDMLDFELSSLFASILYSF